MIDRLSKSFFKSFQKLKTIGDYDLIDINLGVRERIYKKGEGNDKKINLNKKVPPCSWEK